MVRDFLSSLKGKIFKKDEPVTYEEKSKSQKNRRNKKRYY